MSFMENQSQFADDDVIATCTKCKKKVRVRLSWQKRSDGQYHLRVDCTECGRWIKWAIQDPELLKYAPPKPKD
jgi:RNase P subunit RPR2